MSQTSSGTLPRLNVTSLSQYVRLENCDRFLRLRLRQDEERALLKRWNLTIQPLTPLLQESGAQFEREIMAHIAGHGESLVNDEKLAIGDMKGAVVTIPEDGNLPPLAACRRACVSGSSLWYTVSLSEPPFST